MKANEITTAMHLLLANNVFSTANLKELLDNGAYNPDTKLMKQLKAMHDAYVKENKLVSDSMLSQFPGIQIVVKGEKSTEQNMLQFAKTLDKEPTDRYCVHDTAESLGQLICFAYGLKGYDEDAVDEAIIKSDPVILRDLADDLRDIDWMDFIEDSFKFADAFIKELNYLKRNEHGETTDPGFIFRNSQELELGRATRAASYARYSLASLGQFLAILYPIMVVIFAEEDVEDADFINFIYDLRLIELVEHYCCEARAHYGDPSSANVLNAMLEDNPEKFFDPDDEPEDDENHASLKDIKRYFPEIAKILYNEFYV